MARLNKVFFAGNLTRDVEVRYSPGGTPVGKFTIAVNDRIKDGEGYKDDPQFFDCVTFGKTAEIATEFIGKGSSVLVCCRAKQNKWTTADGDKRSKIEFIVEDIQFLGSPRAKSDLVPAGEPGGEDDGLAF